MFKIITVTNGVEKEHVCGQTKNGVLIKLKELNDIGNIESKTLIKEIFFVAKNGDKIPYHILSDGDDLYVMEGKAEH